MKNIKKRLVVDMPLELHKQLKYIAIRYNITLSKLVLRALFIVITEDENIQKKAED